MARIEKQVTVKREHGLHARPATLFVQLANKFNSSIRVKSGGEDADGKSIIAILSLGVNRGTKIKILVEGEDAKEAFEELERFIQEDK